MQRRAFLQALGGLALFGYLPTVAAASGTGRLLILVELKGGNDGLNTVVPVADPLYTQLRPRLALARDELVALNERTALHGSLQPLVPSWQAGELAIVQSLGYPQPNLSHFRSIEIWDTASRSDQYLHDGWLARALIKSGNTSGTVADGVAIGSSELGPLLGGRSLVLSNPDQFKRQAKLAGEGGNSGMSSGALRHLLQVERDVHHAAERLELEYNFRTEFPKGGFSDLAKTACRVIASGNVNVIRLTLGGFDTHQNQRGTQAGLLKQLADGLVAMRSALLELGRWQDTLIFTYSEFGRRPRENQSGGTDHGTAAPHFVLGGRVKGGFYGAPPALDRLDANGNLPFAVDFRSLYASVLERWLGVQGTAELLGGHFKPLDLLRS